MPDWSESERVALIEAGFRIANERLAAWEERYEDTTLERYYCECARPACREQLQLGKADYEAIRADPKRFLIRPGHEMDGFEVVVKATEDFAVVEKPDAMLHIVVPSDPRETRDPRAAADEIARDVAPAPE